MDRGRQPRRPRLQSLRPADFAAIGGHGGIVGHILWLEGHNVDSALPCRPAKPGHQQRFPDIRASPLNHQRRHARPRLPIPALVTR